ncbi:MAG: secretin N-terminal domain-containing protein, partial [Phycisphaerae bacterium]
PSFKTGPDDYTLVVNCKPRQWPAIEEFVKLFDIPSRTVAGAGLASSVYNVDKMPPSVLVNLIQAQYGAAYPIIVDNSLLGGEVVEEIDFTKDANRPSDEGDDPPDVSPCVLPRTITASLTRLIMAQTAPDDVDDADTNSATPVDAQAAEVQPIRLVPDDETGQIRVIGPSDRVADIEKLIEDLTEDIPIPIVTKAYILAYADVNYAGQLLDQIFNERRQTRTATPRQPPNKKQQDGKQPGKTGQPQPPQAQLKRGATAARIKVVPDARSRKLFVKAPVTDFPIITAILRSIDVEASTLTEYRIFQLKNLNAEATAKQLREILFPASRNRTGRGRTIQGAAQKPGQQPKPGQPQPQAAQAPSANMRGAVTANEETTSITPDPQTNSIIAMAEPPTLDLIERLINDLESQTNVTKPDMRIVQLENARAHDVVRALKPVLDAEQRQVKGKPGAVSKGKVVMTEDPGANQIVLAGPQQELDRFEAMIAKLDTPTDSDAEEIVYEVKGDPQEYQKILDAMFVKSAGGGGDVIITSSVSTQTVIVRATRQMHDKIAAQIGELDKRAAGVKQIRTIQLVLANAEKVAEKLTTIYRDRGRRRGQQELNITGMNDTKTLYVQAPDDLFEEIERHARVMDTAPVDLDIKSYSLKKAIAEDVVKRMDELMAKVIQSTKVTGGKAGDIGVKTFAYTADPLTNSIIVTGEPLAFTIAERVISLLDVEPADGKDQRFVKLEHARADEAADFLTRAWQASTRRNRQGQWPVTIVADTSSNQIIVTSSEEDFAKVVEQVMAIDVPGGEMTTESFTIKYADPGTLASIINQQFRNRGSRNPNDQVMAAYEFGTQSVVVTANARNMEKVRALIETTDVEGALKKDQNFIALEYARAEDVARVLNQAWQQAARRTRTGQLPVNIVADSASNKLLVTASAEDFAKVEAQVAQMDIEGQNRQTRTFSIKHADPSALVQIINRQFQNRTRDPNEDVIAAADVSTQTLVVRANVRNMAAVSLLIESVDVDNEQAQQKAILTVENAN